MPGLAQWPRRWKEVIGFQNGFELACVQIHLLISSVTLRCDTSSLGFLFGQVKILHVPTSVLRGRPNESINVSCLAKHLAHCKHVVSGN